MNVLFIGGTGFFGKSFLKFLENYSPSDFNLESLTIVGRNTSLLEEEYYSKEDIPFSIALPAFITSELKTAFQIGFLLFLPFLVIDMVVASVLMSLGMMMLSPMLVALPFKILLFVLVDGWSMTVGSLVSTFVSE